MSDFKKRITGEVPAPDRDLFNMIREAGRPVLRLAVLEGEKLGAKAERTAVLQAFDKAISACGTGSPTDRGALIALSFLRDHIAKGGHVK